MEDAVQCLVLFSSYIRVYCHISLCNATDMKDEDLIPRSGRSLEKEMATLSSISAWEISWTEEPHGVQSMGLQKSRAQMSN